MNTRPADVKEIRTAPHPSCTLCGSAGEFIYLALRDRLFGTVGAWNLKQCNNRKCRLIWLDPMPLEEDLGSAYARYYTHAAAAPRSDNEVRAAGLARQCYRLMKRGYLASKYGYQMGRGPRIGRHIEKLFSFFPVPWRQQDLAVRHLSAVPQGRLLDVGCGQGQWLFSMREMGWQVDGVDFDERAAKAGAEAGLAIRCGSLEQQNFPSETFDAVTMSHVIEHLPEPAQTLGECARILKPGGKLVVWTPNTSSLGCRVLKQDWRGLEPPRHLYLFSPRSMRLLLERAGFDPISIRTRNSRYIWQQGFMLRTRQLASQTGFGQKPAIPLASTVLALLEEGLLLAFAGIGEWLDVQACRR